MAMLTANSAARGAEPPQKRFIFSIKAATSQKSFLFPVKQQYQSKEHPAEMREMSHAVHPSAHSEEEFKNGIAYNHIFGFDRHGNEEEI